jgi:hypothetical protein
METVVNFMMKVLEVGSETGMQVYTSCMVEIFISGLAFAVLTAVCYFIGKWLKPISSYGDSYLIPWVIGGVTAVISFGLVISSGVMLIKVIYFPNAAIALGIKYLVSGS